jgi:ABC-type transport system substrate-binding protein
MPKFMKRALLLLTAFAVLSVSLCACAGSTSSGSSSAVSAVPGEPSVGGSVAVGISQDLDNLDPHKAVNAGTNEVSILGDGWTTVTKDGRLSAHFEHTIAITPDGPVIMTDPDGKLR